MTSKTADEATLIFVNLLFLEGSRFFWLVVLILLGLGLAM
jgi:hypothetical protein